jgi:hypothetical protein
MAKVEASLPLLAKEGCKEIKNIAEIKGLNYFAKD